MAQRNPMNERYLGDGPSGQTRKSASSAKPATQAASSVRIKKKPQTSAEKRAAQKAREKEVKAKAEEKARKAEEKAKAMAALEAEQANDDSDDAGDGSDGGKDAQGSSTGNSVGGKAKKTINKIITPDLTMPEKTAEFRKWRRVYWTLVVIGFVCVGIYAYFAFFKPGLLSQNILTVILVVAYPAIIGALVIDFRKVKPLMKAHEQASSGNKSPKQLKHEEQARQEAAALEAARKAAKAAKRRPKRRKDTIVSGDAPDNSTAVPGQDTEIINPGEEAK